MATMQTKWTSVLIKPIVEEVCKVAKTDKGWTTGDLNARSQIVGDLAKKVEVTWSGEKFGVCMVGSPANAKDSFADEELWAFDFATQAQAAKVIRLLAKDAASSSSTSGPNSAVSLKAAADKLQKDLDAQKAETRRYLLSGQKARNELKALKGKTKLRQRHPTLKTPKAKASDMNTKVTTRLEPFVKQIYSDADEQEAEVNMARVVVDAVLYMGDKVVEEFIKQFEALAQTPDKAKWTDWVTAWGKALVNEGAGLSTLLNAVSMTANEWKEATEKIVDSAFFPLHDTFSSTAVTWAAQVVDGKRGLSEYFKDAYRGWWDFASSGWADGVGGKLLSIVKAPLAVLGFVGSVIADVIYKPIVGKSINRTFAENRGLDISYAAAPVASSSADTSGGSSS